jgi:penicillin amidase
VRRFPPTVLAGLLMLFAMPPVSAGATTVPGLIAPVRVYRDVHSVPHIFAANDHDAIFALGRAHAQDRFFQMDVLRHTFSGTLGELMGGAALPQDVQLRTLGLRRAAEASLPVLSADTRAWLGAYAAGVNSFLSDTGTPLPAEYTVLELTRATVKPWTATDTLTIAKGLAFGLSFDLSDINNTIALETFKGAGAQAGFDGAALFFTDLYRAAPFDPTVSIPSGLAGKSRETPAGTLPGIWTQQTLDLARRYRDQARRVPLLAAALERKDAGRGSNWWVASGAVTASHRPILANDPHLSLGTPSTFYEAQIEVSGGGKPLNAFGITFPGVPGIVLGCNLRICWGATTNPMDVTDVYQEKLVIDPVRGVPVATLFDGKPEPLQFVPQTFLVNTVGDGKLDDIVDAGVGPLDGGVTLIVPRRNHGPIVSVDLSNPASPAGLSVQYTGWGPTRELDAFRTWNRAANLADFKQGLKFFDFGSQNWSYADVDGNIAYFTSAELPLREDLQTLGKADGGVPPYLIRDGTHALKHEWLPAGSHLEPGQALPYQILPFAEMPQVVNPKNGFIANANNDPIGTSVDNDPLNQHRKNGGIYYLGTGYDGGFRIGRIERLIADALTGGRHLSVADFERFQANNQLLDAEVLTPYLLAAFDHATAAGAPAGLATLAADPRVSEALGRLRAWDFSTPTGIQEGWDPGDDPTALPAPSPQEVANSVAATIYATWRSEIIRRVIDKPLQLVGLAAYAPGSDLALSAVRHLLDTFATAHGVGASGLNFFNVAGAGSPEEARDRVLLGAVAGALTDLAGDAFAPAYAHSTNQNDYRWGRIHRIVYEHPLGASFDIPPAGGLSDLATTLPGLARAGGFGTVDAATHDARASDANSFLFDSGPARRFIGMLNRSGPVAEEVIPGGTSGLPGNFFQADQLRLWLTNHYHAWDYKPGDVVRNAQAVEVLQPGS